MTLLALTTVALPVAFDPSSALPHPVVKAGLLGVLAYALAATLALKVLTVGLPGLPRLRLLAPAAAFLVAMAAAAVFAVDPNLALWGAYDRRLGLVAALQMAVIFLAGATFARTRGDLLIVLGGVGAGGILVLGYAIAQRLGLDPIRWMGATREMVFSSLGNSNIMGQYFAVLAAASSAALLGLFPLGSRKWPVIGLALVSGAFAAGTVLSGARTALLGLAIGAAMAVALAVWRLHAIRGRRFVVVGIALGAALLGGAGLLFTPAGARIAALAQGTDLSFAERRLLYGTILEIARDRLLLGVGPDNLAAVYNAYRPTEALTFGALLTQSSAHGWPWRVLLDAGAFGLLLFGTIVLGLGVEAAGRLRRSADWEVPVLVVALVTYLAAGFFAVNDLGTDWLFWLASGLLLGVRGAPTVRAMHSLRGWRVLVAALLAVGVLWPFLGLTRDLGASRALLQSRALARRDAPGALVQARKVVELDDRWPDHWNSLGLRALEAGDRGLALASFERATRMGPYDPLIWKNLGTLQAQLGREQPDLLDRARVSAERAVTADPRNPLAHAGAAQIYLVLRDGAAAAREAEAALALAPGNDGYLELAAVAYLEARRADAALPAILGALAIGESSQRRLVLARVYIVLERYAAASAALTRALELEPGNRDATRLLQEIAGR